VKLEVVALDYDGTIAEHGVLHPAIPARVSDRAYLDGPTVRAVGG
jgi:hypothetical protein